MAEEEELKSDILSPNTLIAWERIQLPSLSNKFQSQSQSQSPVIVLSDPHDAGGKRSTPKVNKEQRTSVVFPPTNHEGLNLNLHHQFDVRETYEEEVKQSTTVSSELKPPAMAAPIALKWRFSHFKLSGIVSCIWNLSVIKGGLFRSFNFPFIGSILLLLLFHFRYRIRRRHLPPREALLSVIKEKEEKIGHLLYQIARMNELLLATHHGVPMISKAASS